MALSYDQLMADKIIMPEVVIEVRIDGVEPQGFLEGLDYKGLADGVYQLTFDYYTND